MSPYSDSYISQIPPLRSSKWQYSWNKEKILAFGASFGLIIIYGYSLSKNECPRISASEMPLDWKTSIFLSSIALFHSFKAAYGFFDSNWVCRSIPRKSLSL
ncbi:MAG: hypothetical protein C00003105_00999 [ANME-2 cluster archaeon HR1]|nr:MAG: hypothetical protein C00003105_00999 [ANME-2 cluster archaeon HR1]